MKKQKLMAIFLGIIAGCIVSTGLIALFVHNRILFFESMFY